MVETSRHTGTRLSRFAKNLLALGIGMLAVYVMWRCMERVFHSVNERNDARIAFEGSYYTDYLRYDSIIGPKGAPNVRVQSVKKFDGKTLYDVEYSTDACGRRNTCPSAPPAKDKFIAFFGCSYTFGEGLPDNETLPWQVAAMAPDERVYNYGGSGYGPQQMLAKIESGEFAREVPEKAGIAVYVFIPNHVRRAIGSMRIATKWGRAFPNYVPDPEYGVVRRGDFTTGRPTLSRVYSALASIDTLRYFGVDIPVVLTRKHLDLTAGIVRRAGDLFTDAFPGQRFVVLIYPDTPAAGMSGKVILPSLARQGIEYIDFSDLLDMRQQGMMIEGDEHPSAEANRRVAEALLNRLAQK